MSNSNGFETYSEDQIASALQWMAFLLSWFLFVFYAWQVKRQTCGWEVIYIAWIEMIKYILEIWWEETSPATIRLTNGTIAPWLRYAEWLLTCPVILIALSRVGTTEGSYNKRTMKLLTSDQGTIIMGVTAAYSQGLVKGVFFCVGVCYGFSTFYTAAAVYLEAWKNVPDDCKNTVKYMAYCFYASWLMFPILFIAGPEGAGHISPPGSVIGHSIADLLSKNLWGLMDWWLDYNVKIRSLMEEEEDSEEGDDDSVEGGASAAKDKKGGKGGAEKANVILGDPRGSLVPFYEREFANLPAALHTIANNDELRQVLMRLQANGESADFVLVAPAFLESDEFQQLREDFGLKVIVFVEGLATIPENVLGPFKELCDDFIEAPTLGSPFDAEALPSLFYKYASSISGSEVAIMSQMKAQNDKILNLQREIANLQQMLAPQLGGVGAVNDGVRRVSMGSTGNMPI